MVSYKYDSYGNIKQISGDLSLGNIKDNYFIYFLEEIITKNNIYSFLNYMEASIIDNYDANIIIVSDTNELFKKSECLFCNGDNLNVDFIFHNLNDNSYISCMDRFGNPFFKILKPIKKEILKQNLTI